MPERLRSIVNRLRSAVGERRHATRYRASLPVSVSLPGHGGGGAHHAGDAPALAGHTYDLCATGLGLILPAVRIGGRYIMGEGRQVLVTLELPAGSIRFRATPTRYERLEEGADEKGYFVGAHISEMGQEERALFTEHLRKLRKG